MNMMLIYVQTLCTDYLEKTIAVNFVVYVKVCTKE